MHYTPKTFYIEKMKHYKINKCTLQIRDGESNIYYDDQQ
jgi:hypothetical protein